MLTQDDGVLSRIQTRPGAINYGGLNGRGEPLIRPMETGGNLPFGAVLLDSARKVINDAFLVTLFQVVIDSGSDRMTATEVMAKLQEKGILVAPAGGRIETELLGPMIEREIDIHARAGILPPMPDVLIKAGGAYKVVYDNVLSRAAKAEMGTGFLRTIEQLAPIAQIDPTVYDIFDPEAAANGLADINGVPQAWRRTQAQMDALKAQRTQQAEAQQLSQAVPLAAKSALDFAKAGQAANDGSAAVA